MNTLPAEIIGEIISWLSPENLYKCYADSLGLLRIINHTGKYVAVPGFIFLRKVYGALEKVCIANETFLINYSMKFLFIPSTYHFRRNFAELDISCVGSDLFLNETIIEKFTHTFCKANNNSFKIIPFGDKILFALEFSKDINTAIFRCHIGDCKMFFIYLDSLSSKRRHRMFINHGLYAHYTEHGNTFEYRTIVSQGMSRDINNTKFSQN